MNHASITTYLYPFICNIYVMFGAVALQLVNYNDTDKCKEGRKPLVSIQFFLFCEIWALRCETHSHSLEGSLHCSYTCLLTWPAAGNFLLMWAMWHHINAPVNLHNNLNQLLVHAKAKNLHYSVNLFIQPCSLCMCSPHKQDKVLVAWHLWYLWCATTCCFTSLW